MNRQTIADLLTPEYRFHAFVACDRPGAKWVKAELLENLEPRGRVKTQGNLLRKMMCSDSQSPGKTHQAIHFDNFCRPRSLMIDLYKT